MTSLFSDIKSYFSAEYQGRYFALILLELARNEPETFGRIFSLEKRHYPNRKNGCQLVCEWPFEHKGAKARADLALLDGDAHPVLLIEIKEDDIVNKKNIEQLQRYISYAKSKSRKEKATKLAYVSRYAPSDALLGVIEKNKALAFEVRYRDILKSLKSGIGIVGKLVHDYLEDIGVGTYKHIDVKSRNDRRTLIFMTARMLGFPHAHGFGRLNGAATISAIPDMMQRIFGNLEVLGDWVKSQNEGLFSQAFTRDFGSKPQYEKNTLEKALEDKYLEIKNSSSGWVWFACRGAICNGRSDGKWACVELGYFISPEKEKGLSIEAFASFEWKGHTFQNQKSITNFHKTEDAAFKVFSTLLNKSLEDAKKSNPDTKIMDALNKFKVPSAG